MFDPIKYANEPWYTETDKELFKWLRQLDEVSKFTFVWRVINVDAYKGCELVKRSHLEPILLEVILEKGLVYGDASSVEWYIKAVLPGLGYKRVLEIIRNQIDIAPLCVYKTLYWLPLLYINQSKKLNDEVQSLVMEFVKKYPGYQPRRSIGTHI
jgi:hypothetical protein